MKVLCIKEGKWFTIITHRVGSGPKYGDVCTVVGRSAFGDDYYVLLEWPDSPNGFARRWFIPISDIDETEFVRNYKTETV